VPAEPPPSGGDRTAGSRAVAWVAGCLRTAKPTLLFFESTFMRFFVTPAINKYYFVFKGKKKCCQDVRRLKNSSSLIRSLKTPLGSF